MWVSHVLIQPMIICLVKHFDIIKWLEAGGKLGIGSDSRLTADGDLLMR